MAIKFGILGCGHIAKKHAEHINNHPEAELHAVYDINSEAAKKLANTYNTYACPSSEAFFSLADLDIINICTPNGLHCAGSIAALEKGKHVLVEKPMALSIDDCEKMINTALDLNRQLFVVKQNRFSPPAQAMKKLIAENKLGEVYSVQVNCFWNRNELYYTHSDWKGTKELDGGTLYTQFSHFVDILYYFFGDITQIEGKIVNANHKDLIEFEDTGYFTFQFKNGGLGSFNYTTSCYESNMEASMTIFAEHATIKIGGQYLNSIEYQKTAGFDIEGIPTAEPANDYGHYKGSASSHDKVIDNVVKALRGQEKIMTNAMEGMKVVSMIERMYDAAKTYSKPNLAAPLS